MNQNSNVLVNIDTKKKLKMPHYKSTMEIGNIKINNIKHFNWFQKRMWNLCFGIKILTLKESELNKYDRKIRRDNKR